MLSPDPISLVGHTTAALSMLPFVTGVAQKGFLVLVNKFFTLNTQSQHFSCSSKLITWVAFIETPLLSKD